MWSSWGLLTYAFHCQDDLDVLVIHVCQWDVSENCFSCFVHVGYREQAANENTSTICTNTRKSHLRRLLTSLNLSIHFWPLGSRATDTSGPSSGGGGWGAQLYSRFSSGTPSRSYCAACCLKFFKLNSVGVIVEGTSVNSLQILVTVQADDGKVSILK